MFGTFTERHHDRTASHHLSPTTREDPGIGNHLQHTGLPSRLVPHHYHLHTAQARAGVCHALIDALIENPSQLKNTTVGEGIEKSQSAFFPPRWFLLILIAMPQCHPRMPASPTSPVRNYGVYKLSVPGEGFFINFPYLGKGVYKLSILATGFGIKFGEKIKNVSVHLNQCLL